MFTLKQVTKVVWKDFQNQYIYENNNCVVGFFKKVFVSYIDNFKLF